MRVLIFGHSYVRDLLALGDWNRQVRLSTGKLVDLEFLFRYYSGKDFDYFLDKPEPFQAIKDLNPDMIVVILGGNLIVNGISNSNIKLMADNFYCHLQKFLRPDCVRFAAQVEPRFVISGNNYGTPEAEEFERRRRQVNNFFNTILKKKNYVDYLVFALKSSDKDLYKPDGVHLNNEGLKRYRDTLLGSLVYALEERPLLGTQ